MDGDRRAWLVVRALCAACCAAALALAARGAPACAAPAEDTPASLPTPVGIALAVAAACVNAAGLHVQRVAHLAKAPGKSHFDSGTWWAGFALILVSEGLMGASYGFAPAAVASPLGSLVVVAAAALAVGRLGERVSAGRALTLVAIAGGSALVAAGAPATQRTLSDGALARRLLLEAPSLALAASSAAAVALLARWQPAREGAALLRLALYAALVSAWTVVGVRGLVSLAARAPADCAACGCANTLGSPVLWFLVATVVLTAYWAGGVVEQRGIARFEQTLWVPVHFCACALLFGAVGAGAYREPLGDPARLAVGTSLCIAGALGHARAPA